MQFKKHEKHPRFLNSRFLNCANGTNGPMHHKCTCEVIVQWASTMKLPVFFKIPKKRMRRLRAKLKVAGSKLIIETLE